MTTKISETKFEALKSKLRELFELDKSDLDFGIYRIMAAKNKEITAFLDRHLKESVREVLESRGSDESTKLAGEIAKAREAAATAGFNPDDSPRVKELEEQYAKLGGGSTEVLEADIYNHLLNFFSRYYDEGDFISKRFYKGDTYAIPYGGEEVATYWANKDQYYIKSGEWHKDYRFRLGDRSVHFRLVEATQEPGNNKERDDSKRRYILASENPVVIDDATKTLTLRFEFRAPTLADGKRIDDSEATRIYGGKYDKNSGRSKGDEREGLCADAEIRALKALPTSWKSIVTTPSPSEAKPKRTTLGKYLDHFTARNSFDYFIHKNLGDFLSRELDFYLKNEVLRIEAVSEKQSAETVLRTYGSALAIRRVALRVISFLASIESFQKRIWLKRKLVLDTHYIVSLKRLPREIYSDVFSCSAQQEAWSRLYGSKFKEKAVIEDERLQYLTVDTSLFSQEQKSKIEHSFDRSETSTTGLLLQGDNFHCVRLLSSALKSEVQCIYIDPPYNTDVSAIPYKNDYKHSSFATMIRDRVACLHELMSNDGVIFVSIDLTERTTVENALSSIFGKSNYIEELIWVQNTNDGRSPTYSTNHEYVLVFAKNAAIVEADASIFREPKPGFADVTELVRSFDGKYPSIAEVERSIALLYKKHRKQFKEQIVDQGLIWEIEKRNDPWKGLYLYRFAEYRDLDGRLVKESKAREANARIWVYRESDWTIMSAESKQSGTTRDPKHPNYRFYQPLHPVTGKPCRMPARGWKGTRLIDPAYPDRNSFESLCNDNRIAFGPDENKVPQQKRMLHEVSTNVAKSVVVDYSDGEKETASLFGRAGVFLAPKHSNFVKRFLRQASHRDSLIVDCFGGSGSTAHAVIGLNREDDGIRRFVLVETNRYFDTLIKPRMQKISLCSKWSKGKPDIGDGVEQCIKIHRVESYEDALNNLPSADGKLFEAMDHGTRDSLITYSLDLELGPHLLNMDAFKDPWGYKIYGQLAGEDEVSLHNVDMIETFNYLIGLKVQAYGPLERYTAEFVRLPHGDDIDAKGNPLPDDKREGRLRVEGRLRRDAEGPYVYQRVEGELNDGNATRVLVIWRKLTDDAEKDAAVLEAWMARHRETTKERSDYREYHIIYLNGPITLPQPTQELRTVLPTEQTFKDRMFEDTEV